MDDQITQEIDYRSFLLNIFKDRKCKNPRYSLRAFARDLQMSHSHLSEVFSGKGDLSFEKADGIAHRLTLTPSKSSNFKDMVLLQTSTDASERHAARQRLLAVRKGANRRDLTNDEFHIIATPDHMLVFTCMLLKSFDGTCDSIQRLTGLNSIEIYDILCRLERLRLVSRKLQLWVACDYHLTIDNGLRSEWIRLYHKDMIKRGRKAIDTFPMSTRHLRSIMLPVSLDKIVEIQHKITNFCQTLVDEYSSGDDAVYGLSLQLFPLSKLNAGDN
jgi:uncharacterized protein (TIGR02147 family)